MKKGSELLVQPTAGCCGQAFELFCRTHKSEHDFLTKKGSLFESCGRASMGTGGVPEKQEVKR